MRLGFIGGNGHHYLKNALTDNDLSLEAVAISGEDNGDTNWQKQADQLEQAWGKPVERFDDPVAMLEQFKPTFASVGAIYADNGKMVSACLERDVPVVSDKPIAVSWEQLDQVCAVAEGSAAQVVTEFDFRSRACFRAARDAAQAGVIGEPILATAQKSYRYGSRPAWYADRARYGGTILWIASHGIDAVRFVTGKRLVRATGQQGNMSKPDMGSFEDHTVSLFDLENGGKAVVHADFLRPAKAPSHGDDRIRVVGTKGQLEVRDDRCVLMTHDDEPRDITDDAKPAPIHREMLAALRGEANDLYGTAWSLELSAVLLAARDSADQKAWVDIPHVGMRGEDGDGVAR